MDEITPPLDAKGDPKLKFEVKIRPGKNGVIEKAIFIGDELLDWSVDVTSLLDAARMGPAYYRAAQKDIEKHFVESVSEFVGRKLTPEDIKQAIDSGWI
jgi:hypothetical protein